MPARDPVRIAKPFVFALGMLPILWLGWAFLIALGTFSPNALTPPLIYAAVFAVLLAYRALKRMSKNPAHGVSAAAR